MDVCEKLSDLDLANQRKWAAHKERLKGKADEIMQRKAQLGSLRKSIDEALFRDEWERLKLLCETYLEIEDDSSIEDYRNKACRKLEMKQREIEAQQPHKEHDFFDEAKAGKTQSDSKGKYTNDDFNF